MVTRLCLTRPLPHRPKLDIWGPRTIRTVHCSVCGCVDGAAFATRLLSLYATVAHRSSVIPSSHRRRKIDALQPNPRLPLVTITSWGNSPMETLPPYQEANALHPRWLPTQARLA